MRPAAALKTILLSLLLAQLGMTQQAQKAPPGFPSQKTLYFGCSDHDAKRVFSPVALSEGAAWRAYVEVDEHECLYTTRLWVARQNSPYRLLYLMPPNRWDQGNGMEILGWSRNSTMLLVETMQWQDGSDAMPIYQVLGFDAKTGMEYDADLEAMLEGHPGKQCGYSVTDAGFSASRYVDVLVRARFFTFYDVEETEADVPPSKQCGDFDETWSFNFANSEIKRAPPNEALQIFRNFQPNPSPTRKP